MFSRLLAAAVLVSSPAMAEAPRVVVDIAPVHGLVSMIMQEVADPVLLLPPGASPHHYALRPSEARALQDADLVIWVGPALTPWLEKPLGSLASGATRLGLLDAAGGLVLEYASHNTAEVADGGEDDHGQDDERHGHDHAGPFDPHAWLDPHVARLWTDAIAASLAAADPDNASVYIRNARAARTSLKALDAELSALLAPVAKTPFVTFHDAYRYFERRYDLTNIGTVTSGDATSAGAAGLAHLRREIADRGVTCAFSEPQFDASLLTAAGERGEVEIAILDPMGVDLETGPELYPTLLRRMAVSLEACLSR